MSESQGCIGDILLDEERVQTALDKIGVPDDHIIRPDILWAAGVALKSKQASDIAKNVEAGAIYAIHLVQGGDIGTGGGTRLTQKEVKKATGVNVNTIRDQYRAVLDVIEQYHSYDEINAHDTVERYEKKKHPER